MNIAANSTIGARVDVLLSRLDGVRQVGPGRWMAKCPAHEDRSASLSIREMDDGRILLHDFAGCDVSAVLTAVGLSFNDLFPERLGEFKPERPERPPITRAVLRAVADECMVVLVAAYNTQCGIMTPEDFDRLHEAHNRIAAVVEAIYQ